MDGGIDRPWPLRRHGRLAGRWLLPCFAVLLAALCATLWLGVRINPGQHQGDLAAYYFAGKALQAGQDPYDIDVLSSLAHTPLSNGFVYPPITLPIFRLLANLPYAAVYRGFLLLKAGILLGMLALWLKAFVNHSPWVFLGFVALSFNAAVYVDFRVGNIAIFEQALIWVGFYWLMRQRPLPFTLSILAASLFKVTPLAFLGLLLLTKQRSRIRHLLLGGGLFAGMNFIGYLASPTLFQGFLSASSRLTDRGVVNPSTAALIRDAYAGMSNHAAGAGLASGPGLIYLLAAGAITFVTLMAAAKARVGNSGQELLLQIFLVCLAYGLVVPRFKTYSYVLVVVPTFYVLMRAGHHLRKKHSARPLLAFAPLLVVTGISSSYAAVYGPTLVSATALGYAPWAALFLTWLISLTGIGLRGKGWLLQADQHAREAEPIPEDRTPSLPPQIYTQDYYLQVCGGYREFLDGGMASRLEEAIRLGMLEPGITVLDIGSGRGEMAIRCAEGGCRVWGIDYSADALALSRDLLLRKAKAGWEGQVIFQKMNSKALAFADASFDRVFLIDVVEHLYPLELQTALKEAARVTRPGGRLVIHTAPNAWLIKPIYLLAALLFRWKHHPYHVYEQSYVSLKHNLRWLGGKLSIRMSKIPGFFSLGVGERAGERSRFARLARALDRVFDHHLVAFLIDHTPLKYALATDLWATLDLPPDPSRPTARPA